MTLRRLLVGERALVSRDESGENHEEATVIDYYELLIGAERRPMVVVDFDDGERKWLTAAEPNVIAIEPEDEDDEEPGDDGDGAEASAAETGGEGEGLPEASDGA